MVGFDVSDGHTIRLRDRETSWPVGQTCATGRLARSLDETNQVDPNE